MPKSILYVVGKYLSISEQFVEREIAGLRERGLDIVVCSLDDICPSSGVYSALQRPSRLAGLYRTLRRDPTHSSRKRCAGALLRAVQIAYHHRDIVHVHGHFLGLPGTTTYCLSHLLGVPYSLSAHAHDIYVESTPDEVIRGAKFRVTCTQANVDFLRQLYPKYPFELLRHGIDISSYPNERAIRTGGTCKILAVGRLVEKKGFIDLIRACARLARSTFPFHCSIIGEGPEYATLNAEIASLGIAQMVSIHPFQPHETLRTHYRESDMLVQPCIVTGNGDRDGVPNVILEALASGLPVIASDSGSIAEVIEDRQTGSLVPQHAPDALAIAISALWSDLPLREHLSRKGRERIQNQFNPTLWLDRLKSLFVGDHNDAAQNPTCSAVGSVIGPLA